MVICFFFFSIKYLKFSQVINDTNKKKINCKAYLSLRMLENYILHPSLISQLMFDASIYFVFKITQFRVSTTIGFIFYFVCFVLCVLFYLLLQDSSITYIQFTSSSLRPRSFFHDFHSIRINITQKTAFWLSFGIEQFVSAMSELPNFLRSCFGLSSGQEQYVSAMSEHVIFQHFGFGQELIPKLLGTDSGLARNYFSFGQKLW